MKRYQFWLLAILLLALLLRLVFLGSKSIWLDEAFSVWNASRTPAEIWNATNDNHPPLYYLILRAWMALGDDEAVIRLPSVFISMAGLALLFILARRLFDTRVALFALALLALAPLDLWYAQEARMVIFVIPAALLIALGLTYSGWRSGFLIFAGLALGLYLDYTIIPLWILLSSIWFVTWWRDERSWTELVAWLGASLAAWLVFFPQWSHLYLVAGRMSDIFVFASIRDGAGLPNFGPIVPLLALIILALGTVIAAHWIPNLLFHPQVGKIVVLLSVVVFLILTALTPVPRLYSLKRLLVTGWPFVILGVSWLATRKFTNQNVVVSALLAVSLSASLVVLFVVPKDDWRSAVSTINKQAAPGDIAWLDPASGRLAYDYYDPVLNPQYSADLLGTPSTSDIWHIAERQPNRPIPGSKAERWLDANRMLIEIIPLYRLELRHYSSAK